MHGHKGAVRGPEAEFASGDIVGRGPQQVREAVAILRRQKGVELLPHQPLLPDAQHLGEARIAVEHHAVPAERQGAFLDLLDQHAIGPVGAFERVDLRGVARPLHHDRVEVAAANGLERLLAFLEPRLEVADPRQVGRGLLGRKKRGIAVGRQRRDPDEAAMPRARSTRGVSDRSPMMRRTGKGRSFSKVGAATTWSDSTRSGWR